jgi:hypothetical protein
VSRLSSPHPGEGSARDVLNVAHHAFNVALAGRTPILLFFDTLKNKKPSAEPIKLLFCGENIHNIPKHCIKHSHPASATLKAWCATFKTVLANFAKFRYENNKTTL